MRAGEMSVLKRKNVDFERKIIKGIETRVAELSFLVSFGIHA
jgi:hypothetical protein